MTAETLVERILRHADRDLPWYGRQKRGRHNRAFHDMIRAAQERHHGAPTPAATELAEDWAAENEKEAWLDDPDHWIWDAAALALDWVAATADGKATQCR